MTAATSPASSEASRAGRCAWVCPQAGARRQRRRICAGICRARPGEAVYALLHVANHEEPAPAAGDGVDDVLLHAGDVLVLVDHYLRVAARKLEREGRGRAVLLRQELGGQVLGVREVYQRAALLSAHVLAVEGHDELQQRLHRRAAALMSRSRGALGVLKSLASLAAAFLRASRRAFMASRSSAVSAPRAALSAGKAMGRAEQERVPAPARGLERGRQGSRASR